MATVNMESDMGKIRAQVDKQMKALSKLKATIRKSSEKLMAAHCNVNLPDGVVMVYEEDLEDFMVQRTPIEVIPSGSGTTVLDNTEVLEQCKNCKVYFKQFERKSVADRYDRSQYVTKETTHKCPICRRKFS
eukprot:GEMP01088930.1.p1 GENE.GEMP01088930.1~~GEMP01088930.1.p1  ORF type:complete len:132 (+),score=20.75 GEMP01088930.1:51-446(+)